MRKNAILNSPRLLELRRKKYQSTKRKIIIFCVFLFVFILGLSFAFRIPALNIDKVIISGNRVVETNDILEMVQSQIFDDYFYLFSKTNFLIYPKNKIDKKLKENFKRIKDISINNKDIKNLEISISEYEGEYLYCGVLLPILQSNLNNNKCYFLDNNGYIFDEAPYFSGEVYFKFYGYIDNENPVGSYFLKEKFVDLINFKDTIEKLGLNLNSFYLLNDLEHEREGNFVISSITESGPQIIFKIDDDYKKLAENLQAAISTEPLNSDLKKKLSSLLYLDLKFGNKVYFKFK